MAYNKFMTKDGEVMLDLTGDTATEEDVLEGKVFHKVDGTQAVGTLKAGAVSEIDILSKCEFAFALDSETGLYGTSSFNMFTLVSGEEYKVLWGDETFTCTAIESTFMDLPCVVIGNTVALGGEDNGMPFVIGVMPIDETTNNCIIGSLTGETSKIVRIYQVKSGGGSSADVRYVTFMNGDVVLYKKPVAVGDDCVNVVTKGLISTPTKESTEQYNYTYSGWALTSGGTADTTNALANVTEDRTVYAAYTSTVRIYAVRFYDGETLLATKQVAYGTVPTYGTPTKDGYSFDGWEPALSEVTGDQDYYAQWTEKISFAGASWDKIIEIANEGKGAENFSVGDTRVETLNYADGTSEDITLTIIGFDHDTLYNSTEKANISIISNVLANDRVISTTLSNGHLWSQTGLRSWLRGTLNNALPTELRSAIKAVSKTQTSSADRDAYKTTETTSETVFVLDWTTDCYSSTSKYPIFNNGTEATERFNAYKTDGSVADYWFRSGKVTSAGKDYWLYRKSTTTAFVPNEKKGTETCGVRFVFNI